MASIPCAVVVAAVEEDDDIAASGLREKPTRTLLTQASLFDVVAARKAVCTLQTSNSLLPLSAPFSPGTQTCIHQNIVQH